MRNRHLALAVAILLAVPHLFAAIGSPATTQPAPASARFRVAEVVDRRAIRTDPAAEPPGMFDRELRLTLQLAGLPDLPTATAYGQWQVDVAEDDRGTDLRPAGLRYADLPGSTTRVQAERFESLDRREAKLLLPGPDGFADQPFALTLATPARGATRIRRLAGHVDLLVGGTDHVARFARPLASAGTPMADADMAAVGVSVLLDRPDPPDRLTFHLHGPVGLVRYDMVGVTDSAGRSVVRSRFEGGPAAEFPHPLDVRLQGPLDDTMAVTVAVRLGQRAVRVPFDLRDVRLP